jgi:heme-degrading monooxygenase HmoA
MSPGAETQMIVRMWHGRVPNDKAERYRDFLNERAVVDYRSVEGNEAVYILERRDGEETHFITLTLWRDEAAIRQFAGDELTRARYYPEDKDFLLEFEPHVVHYTVVGKAIGTLPRDAHAKF